MISISFKEPCTEVWEEWREKCRVEQLALNGAYAAGRKREVVEKLYREQKEVYFALDGPFHGKCSYCETTVGNQFGHLDHFRPKKGVTDFKGVVTVKNSRGQEIPHKGYYWLAYDCENLLPACEICNSHNKATYRSGGLLIGKGNLFPVVDGGFRAEKPGQETKERPLLLNPTAEGIEIEKHLRVDKIGAILTNTLEGETTCKVFGLNVRLDLVRDRKAAYKEGHDTVLTYLNQRGNENVDDAANSLRTLIEYEAGVRPFSAAGRAGIEAMFKKLRLSKRSVIPRAEVELLRAGHGGASVPARPAPPSPPRARGRRRGRPPVVTKRA